MRGSITITCVLALTLAGCSEEQQPPPPVECEVHDDCPAGHVCQKNECSNLCTAQADCPAGYLCTGGQCTKELTDPVEIPEPPLIEELTGDGSFESNTVGSELGTLAARRVRNAVHILGQHLELGTVKLEDRDGLPGLLELVVVSDRMIVALVPENLVEGQYWLNVSSEGGFDEVAVWFLEGAPGEDILPVLSTYLMSFPDIHRGAPWGRFYEAEEPPLDPSVVLGAPADNPAASRGRVRRVEVAGGAAAGPFYALNASTLGGRESIALGGAGVTFSLRLSNVCPGQDDHYLDLACLELPNDWAPPIELDRLAIHPSDWIDPSDAGKSCSDPVDGPYLAATYNNTWQTFTLGCAFDAGQTNQRIVAELVSGIDAGNETVEVDLDYVRIQPFTECPCP